VAKSQPPERKERSKGRKEAHRRWGVCAETTRGEEEEGEQKIPARRRPYNQFTKGDGKEKAGKDSIQMAIAHARKRYKGHKGRIQRDATLLEASGKRRELKGGGFGKKSKGKAGRADDGKADYGMADV